MATTNQLALLRAVGPEEFVFPLADFIGPFELTASQIATPSAEILADVRATYRLNVAPYTRYVSNGTTLVQQTSTNAGSATFGDGTGTPAIAINGAAGTNEGVNFLTAGITRYRFIMDASQNLNVYGYDLSGAFQGTALGFQAVSKQLFTNFGITEIVSASPAAGATAGPSFNVTNAGTNAAYGARIGYTSVAGGVGFDTGLGIISVYNPVFIGATVHNFQAFYPVCASPIDTTHSWSGNIAEMNFINRGADVGFKRDRALAGNNTGGLLFVPEAIDLSGGGGEGLNVGYGYSIAHSATNNSTGFPAKSYIGYNVEPNSIVGLTGRGHYLTGDISGVSSQYPYGPVQWEATWLHGLDTTLATFIDSNAVTMGIGHGIRWITGTTGTPTASATITSSGSGANIGLALTPTGTGVITLASKVTIPTQTPASAAATGTAGQIAWDSGFVYICVATDTWKRVAIATW